MALHQAGSRAGDIGHLVRCAKLVFITQLSAIPLEQGGGRGRGRGGGAGLRTQALLLGSGWGNQRAGGLPLVVPGPAAPRLAVKPCHCPWHPWCAGSFGDICPRSPSRGRLEATLGETMSRDLGDRGDPGVPLVVSCLASFWGAECLGESQVPQPPHG